MYSDISEYYEEIFPLNRKAVEFSLKRIERGNVLDIGCGTGELAVELSKSGYTAYGIDLDQGMIQAALKKSSNSCMFKVLNMLDAGTVYKDIKFNGITCFGNTIVHLHRVNDYDNFLKDIYNILRSGGKFLIQILNYSYILNNKIKKLPVVENEKFKFYRYYNVTSDNMLEFTIRLESDKGVYEGKTLLNPLKPADIISYLKKAGFSDIKLYGDFSGKEFNEETDFVLIAEASAEKDPA